MPKIISPREKELTLEAIYQNTLRLIKEKGLQNVTVDDITHSADMAKGSFYKYYPTKEECLYEVIKRAEKEGFTKTEAILTASIPDRELLIKLLHEIYIADDSIVLYITPKEIKTLMRKLPSEFADREEAKSADYFDRTLRTLGISKDALHMGVLAHLMDSLAFIASGKDGRAKSEDSQTAMSLIINTIADYLMEALHKGEL